MLVTVASFRDPWEAQLFRSRLEAEGIVALVAHQNHIGMNWAYSTALGGVKVQVPDAELAGVREVVARCRAGGFRDDLLAVFGHLDDPRCPRCGLLHFERRRPYPQVLLALALFLASGVPTPPWKWLRHCLNCGAYWQD